MQREIALFENNIIKTKTLNDAWRDTLWCCIRNGYDYIIEKGSYEGQIRKQLDYLCIIIEEPYDQPFKFFTPPGIPEPTNEVKINKYFIDYLMSDTVKENEDYTYGAYINLQLPKVIKILNDSKGNTNQASITIGEPHSVNLNDPPCLRLIDFKIVNKQLNMSIFFRSWDIFAALPENLAGLQLLKNYVLLNLNFPVNDGKIIAYSSGAHIYEMYFPIVNSLNVDQIKIKEE